MSRWNGLDLEAGARAAWADIARAHRWTVWARLSWAWPVSEVTASSHLDDWARRLAARVPGAAAIVGMHEDTERRHAHALVFIPKRAQPRFPHGVEIPSTYWGIWLSLDWRFGQVWADSYKPGRTALGPHGAAEYLAKFPGTVRQFGVPPRYVSRRRRARGRRR